MVTAKADLTVHGGPSKAVYVYPSEHYGLLEARIARDATCRGSSAKNFTTAVFLKAELNIGDKFSNWGGRSDGDRTTHALLQTQASNSAHRYH